jgi:O-antigen/teichoic acid export membrane protein
VRRYSSAGGQFAAILTSRLTAAAVQALVGLGLARALGPSDYGKVAGFAGVVLFWFIVCDLGVSSCLSRAQAMGRTADVQSALRVNLATSTLGCVVAAPFAVSDPFGTGVGVALLLLVGGCALDKNVDAAMGTLIAAGRRRAPAASVLLRRLATAGCFFGLLAADVDPLWSYCSGMLVGPLLGQLHLRLSLAAAGLGAARGGTHWSSVLHDSTPFAVNDIAIQSRSLDVAVVGLVTSSGMSGLYAGATKLVAPFELASSTLASVVLPRAARAGTSTVRQAGLLFAGGAALLAVLAVPAAWLVSPLIVRLLGESYEGAGPVLTILLAGLPFLALASPLSALLQGSGNERFVAVTGFAFSLVTLAAIGVGARLDGAVGAAMGAAGAAVVKSALLLWRIHRMSEKELDSAGA